MPPARLRVACRTLSQPGAGLARTCAVSSRVGAQPSRPRSNVTGGSASTTISNEIGSGSRSSMRRNQALSSPRPLGAPTAQPMWSGWKRMSKRSISGAILRSSGGAIVFGTHSSGGGIAGSIRRGADVVAEAVEVAVRRERGDPRGAVLAQVGGHGGDAAAVAAHVDADRGRAGRRRRQVVRRLPRSGRACRGGCAGWRCRSRRAGSRRSRHHRPSSPRRGRPRSGPPTLGSARSGRRTRRSRRNTKVAAMTDRRPHWVYESGRRTGPEILPGQRAHLPRLGAHLAGDAGRRRRAARARAPRDASGCGPSLAIALVLFGGLTTALALVRWARVERAMRTHQPLPAFTLGYVMVGGRRRRRRDARAGVRRLSAPLAVERRHHVDGDRLALPHAGRVGVHLGTAAVWVDLDARRRPAGRCRWRPWP